MFLFFVQGASLAIPATILPSPLKVFLVSRSLQNGWRSTIPAVLAPLLTDGPIVAAALLLLNRVPATFLEALRLLGGVFILYLAARFVRSLLAGGGGLQASEEAARQNLRQAVVVNLLNPNPYLLWGIVAGPIVLEGWRRQSAAVGLSFIFGFYLIFVLGLAGLVLLFGTAGQLSPRLNKGLSVIAAVSLVILGVYQIVVGLEALISS